MYNLLVRVFFANERKWIFIYSALGWCKYTNAYNITCNTLHIIKKVIHVYIMVI